MREPRVIRATIIRVFAHKRGRSSASTLLPPGTEKLGKASLKAEKV